MTKRFGVLLCVIFVVGILADRLTMRLFHGDHTTTAERLTNADQVKPQDTGDSAHVNMGVVGKEGHIEPAAVTASGGLGTPGTPISLRVPGALTSPEARPSPGAPAAPGALTLPASPGALAAPAPQSTGTHHKIPLLLPLSHLTLTARADLGQVTFTYHLTPASGNADAGIQMFAHHDEITSEQKWEGINPVDAAGKPVIISLYQGIDNTGSFTVTLPKGNYGECRFLLFDAPDGKSMDMSRVLYDTKNDDHAPDINLHLAVTTSDARVSTPLLDLSSYVTTSAQGDGNYEATFSGTVKVPQGYQPPENGFWVMAKAPIGFAQGWVEMKKAVPGGNPNDNYQKIPFELTVKNIKTGLSTMQFGLFKYTWGDPLHWVYPGVDFAVGNWVHKAPEDHLPTRVRVHNNRFETLDGKPYDFYADRPAGRQAVSFLRGGNYGNALDWTITPEYNRPGYFVLLKGMGCHFMRVIFKPERYIAEALYRDAVDQVVQNIWSAGIYPVLGPQGLMKAPTLQEQVDRSVKLVKVMAIRYKGKPIWLEMCNEPFEVPVWSQWKTIAVKMARAIRDIDPDAFIVAPLEGWSKDGRAVAKDPITEVHIDLYDAHAYIQPEEVARNFTDTVKAGIPLYIGEYGGNDAAYLSRMDLAFQNLHGSLVAAAPWAFTKAGQDSLPLIADGSTAVLHYTPAGQQIANDYALWDQGKQKTQ